jgi:hypothetical protein
LTLQILRAEHLCSVARLIREDLLALDDARSFVDAPPDDLEALVTHVYMGARQKQCTISALEESHQNDLAFRGIRTRLTKFLRENLSAENLPVGRIVIDDTVCHIPRHISHKLVLIITRLSSINI